MRPPCPEAQPTPATARSSSTAGISPFPSRRPVQHPRSSTSPHPLKLGPSVPHPSGVGGATSPPCTPRLVSAPIRSFDMPSRAPPCMKMSIESPLSSYENVPFLGGQGFGGEVDLITEAVELAEGVLLDGDPVALFDVAHAQVLVVRAAGEDEVDDGENLVAHGDDGRLRPLRADRRRKRSPR